jgi:hypothetical protein
MLTKAVFLGYASQDPEAASRVWLQLRNSVSNSLP